MVSVMERFTPRVCAFNPEVDLQEVDQFGFVNLGEALVNGVLPGDMTMSEEAFNAVSEPSTLLHRADDIFDAMRKAEFVRESLSALSAAEREKAHNAAQRTLNAAGENVT